MSDEHPDAKADIGPQTTHGSPLFDSLVGTDRQEAKFRPAAPGFRASGNRDRTETIGNRLGPSAGHPDTAHASGESAAGQGATTENIGSIRGRSNAGRRHSSPVDADLTTAVCRKSSCLAMLWSLA